ncbi:MAG: redox-sensing transcriptional repressor Rex [Candidatus Omnitrophota bacterium]
MANTELLGRHTISRLHHYRKALHKLKQMGFIRVFSDNLADAIGVTSSQVRRDFSVFGLAGNKRGGYSVPDLIEKLDRKLRKDEIQKIVVIGAGNIGKALIGYRYFEDEGMRIAAAFDSDPAKVDRKARVPVLPIEEMETWIKKEKIEVAVLAVPEAVAPQVFDRLAQAGIRGVLNFTPVRLSGGEGKTAVSHINVGHELETLLYLVNSDHSKNLSKENP